MSWRPARPWSSRCVERSPAGRHRRTSATMRAHDMAARLDDGARHRGAARCHGGRHTASRCSRVGSRAWCTRRCAAACSARSTRRGPHGTQIDVHFAVLPALARNKLDDPVFFIAGGPGQSAIELAGPLAAQLARLSNRRDLVFVDQRGTGRSAPLRCDEDAEAMRPLAESVDESAQLKRLARLPRAAEGAAARRPAPLRHDAGDGRPRRRACASSAPRASIWSARRTARGPRWSTCACFRLRCAARCSTAWRRPTWCCRRRSRPTTRRR